MPRLVSNPNRLYEILKLSLGGSAASHELAWMRQALDRKTTTTIGPGTPKDLEVILEDMVKQRARGVPLQYVIGDQPFGHLMIKCRPPTLIPRPETEFWTMRLADLMRESSERTSSLLDICTGTGCIPLLLAHSLPKGTLHAVGVDASESALELAKENVDLARDGSSNPVKIVHGDLFSMAFADDMYSKAPQRRPFDVVTCNPPYIPQEEYDKLSPSVRDHEDVMALLGDKDGDKDGLSFYRRLVEVLRTDVYGESGKHLVRNGGMIVVEHGDGQSDAVKSIFKTGLGGRLSHVEAWKDQYNVDRAVMAVL